MYEKKFYPPPRKRLIIAALGTIFSVSMMFSQSQNWWRTNGNTPQSTDYLGTSNNSPLIIKTNNVERLRIAPNGFIGINTTNPQYVLDVNGRTKLRYNVYCDSLLQCSSLKVDNLMGSGNALLTTDAQGNIIRFNFSGNNNDVLTGNGIWANINSLLPPSQWQTSGQNIYYNQGFVGIGTGNPLFSLDVVGDVRVSNNIYVGGGIVISDKVNAFTEVTAPKMVASEAKATKLVSDSIIMDSTKAIYGKTIIQGDMKVATDADVLGDLRVNNKLTIQGNATIGGDLTINNQLKINSLVSNDTSLRVVYVNSSGNLISKALPNPPSCYQTPFWETGGNYITGSTCNPKLGTTSNIGFNIITNNTPRIYIDATGKVGIGNNNPASDLHLKGKMRIDATPLDDNVLDIYDDNNNLNVRIKKQGIIYTREVEIQTGSFPDYVFGKNYKMMSIEDLENYISKYHKLPLFESAEKYIQNGLPLKDIILKQQETIELLTLYIIQLNKEINSIKKHK